MLELLGRGSAGGSVDGGEVGQVRVLKGAHDPLKGFPEVRRIVVIPTSVEFVTDSNEKGMFGVITNKINQFPNEMIVGTVRNLVLGIAFHGNREMHHATIQSG